MNNFCSLLINNISNITEVAAEVAGVMNVVV